MGCDVYADGDEIACEAGGGKVIAAFPDVCMSPPSPPAGPIPVPYPDTSFSKDMKNGSKNVKISNKPVMLKDKSFYKSSPLGNEAATRSFGAGVVTHVITGKTHFNAWSMDVKFEGLNVPRHIDLTTSNHASPGGNSVPSLNISSQSQANIAANRCPCCGSENCVSAFESGQQPLNFEDYFHINDPGFRDRAQQYMEMKRSKQEECTCDGEVFPQEPCNVLRRGFEKTHAVTDEWNDAKETYASDFRSRNPDAINKFIKRNMKDIKTLGKPPVHGNFNQVDHLVAKAAGGCPDNPNNLQPHDLLCRSCRDSAGTIDGWVRQEAHRR